jgi:2-polyprenyl-3-methyl-5-hydroxy-6-metoxy-1,4-benzoquinol methylase
MQEYLDGTLQGSRSWKGELDKVAFLEQFISSGRILDVGCSDSSFLLALDSQRWDRVGIEYIGGVVEVVRSFFPELEVRQGDVFSESLKEKDFDAVTFWHVLEHLFHPDEVLNRAYRLLKPGGRLVVSVPRFDSYQARVFKEHWFAFDVPRHLHHFSQAALTILMQNAGFTVDEYVFFSKTSTRHHLKHSLLHWSRTTFGSSLPYYLLKPPLMVVPFLEGLTDGYGTMTIVATK